MGQTLLRAALLSIVVCFLGTRPLLGQQGKPATTDVAFYITAHSDDWQLFMGSHAHDDVQRQRTKVVFICVSAGQANTTGETYWRGREAGCRAAVLSLANLNAVPQSADMTQTVANGHSIATLRYKNTVTYFLRLPDGNLGGQGFSQSGFQSLKRLRNGEGPLTDVEGVNTYASWGDLVRTVRHLVQQEKRDGRVWLNTPDADERVNPGDHSDHLMVGRLAVGAMAHVESCQLLYVDYDIAKRKANLTPPQAAKQSAAFAAYCQGIVNNGLGTEWDERHLAFLGRQYYRVTHNSAAGPQVASNTVQQRGQESPDEDDPEIAGLILRPNYPNPFAQASLLAYDLPAAGFVTLRIYDLKGNVVKTLVQEEQPAGRHEVWLEVDQFPASGQYVSQLQAGGQHREQRLQINR